MSENDSVDEIHTEGLKQQEIASIDQLSDGKSFYYLVNFQWLWGLFLVPVSMVSLSFELFGLIELFGIGISRLWDWLDQECFSNKPTPKPKTGRRDSEDILTVVWYRIEYKNHFEMIFGWFWMGLWQLN